MRGQILARDSISSLTMTYSRVRLSTGSTTSTIPAITSNDHSAIFYGRGRGRGRGRGLDSGGGRGHGTIVVETLMVDENLVNVITTVEKLHICVLLGEVW